jgi:hypothetical protein
MLFNQWETGDGGRPRCGMTRVERLARWGGGAVVGCWRGHVGGARGGVPGETRGRGKGRQATPCRDLLPRRLDVRVRACGHAPKERSMLTHPSAWEWEQAGRALSLTGRQ